MKYKLIINSETDFHCIVGDGVCNVHISYFKGCVEFWCYENFTLGNTIKIQYRDYDIINDIINDI